ncbi:nuclear transport factor 2 family protein [Rhodococcus sp. SJ-3]|uniref:nuclear transport factor 2 family protein n=1 Tax=Rhodococcus sp. SJ-3 TaxID=3454628 RepID=UPI003F7B2AB2
MSTSDDLVEINQLLARYAVNMTKGDVDGVMAVFTPDGTYSAFGDEFTLDQFPQLVAAAPQGLFMTGTSLIALDGDTATGTQPLCFVEHSAHDMRIGYYNDTYLRTEAGWRLKTRKMTFIRRSGVHDSGIPHAFEAPTA